MLVSIDLFIYIYAIGLEKELHILCEDLLGPAHSSAHSSGISWRPKIAV
jgi:hypothetical protein